MSEYTPTERAEQKYPFWLPTGDYEIDCEDYSEMDAAWQNAEAEEQRQAYIAGAESERAKRPDREQLVELVEAVTKDYWENANRRLIRGEQKRLPVMIAEAVLSSLALEPEAREEKPPVYLASDLWYALRLPDGDAEFDGYYERNGWADTWSNLLAEVRPRSGARPCGQDADGEPCVLMTESHLVHYGASDVGSSEPLPAPEAREESELFHDQDGDLWKLTDKGEWFHEEEPGEFRQVLSLDAEDQTLTPVGHAELAPAPEAREETGPALRIDDDGAHIYWADPVEGCWVAFRRVDCVGEEELPERRLPAPEAREVTEESVEAAAVAIAGEYDRRGGYRAGTWWSNPRRRDPLRLEARAALEAAREVE